MNKWEGADPSSQCNSSKYRNDEGTWRQSNRNYPESNIEIPKIEKTLSF